MILIVITLKSICTRVILDHIPFQSIRTRAFSK